MRIGPVDTATAVAVIAEIGNNHEGDIAVARELVQAAAEAGAHAVKFQAIEPLELVDASETARVAQLERFRLDPEQFADLAELAHGLGMGFSCTPFSLGAVEWLDPLVDVFKVASGDNDHLELLARVGAAGRPVLVSAGMTGVDGMRRAQRAVLDAGAPEFATLHCISAYPVDRAGARLGTIPVLAAELGCTVGYSDHTLGVEAAVLSVALGARVIEKHFTLRHDFSEFRDHQLSAEPGELRALVNRAAEATAMIGVREADVVADEHAVAQAARRGAVAARDLPAGHVLEAGDVRYLRPAGPIGPAEPLAGRVTTTTIAAGERIAPEGLAGR